MPDLSRDLRDVTIPSQQNPQYDIYWDNKKTKKWCQVCQVPVKVRPCLHRPLVREVATSLLSAFQQLKNNLHFLPRRPISRCLYLFLFFFITAIPLHPHRSQASAANSGVLTLTGLRTEGRWCRTGWSCPSGTEPPRWWRCCSCAQTDGTCHLWAGTEAEASQHAGRRVFMRLLTYL